MTIATHTAARERLSVPVQLNWSAVGVIVAILVHLGAAVWFAASVSTRLHAVEDQLPPGALQRLDERTNALQGRLDLLIDMERRRGGSGAADWSTPYAPYAQAPHVGPDGMVRT